MLKQVLCRSWPAVFLSLPAIPRVVSVFHTDCAGKPLQQTSTGNNQACHSLSLHFPLRGLFTSFFPQYRQFNQDDPLHLLRPYDHIRPQGCLDHLGKVCHLHEALLDLVGGVWLLPLPDELDGLGWFHVGLALFLSLLFQDVSLCSENHFTMPSVSLSADLHSTSKVPTCLSLYITQHSKSSLIPHLCRFVGVGRVSYTDWSRKEMRKGASLQSSSNILSILGNASNSTAKRYISFFYLTRY